MPGNNSKRSIKNIKSSLKILITAGPTREYIDPVRFISNASSGIMAAGLYKAFRALGAKPFLIRGPVDSSLFKETNGTDVVSCAEMFSEVKNRAGRFDIFVGAAAVADYSPARFSAGKIKSSAKKLSLVLKKNPDIISMVKKENPGIFSCGFSLETDPDRLKASSEKKLREKGMDMILANLETNIGSKIKSGFVITKTGAQKIGTLSAGKFAKRLAGLILKEYEKTHKG